MSSTWPPRPKLRDELAEAARGSAVVILDLSELTFMDSTGLHVIFSARARLAEAGRRLVVVPGSQQVQQIFEITGTKHHFEFVNAPNAPRPATVRSGTEAFLHAHLSRRKNANDRTFGADHPSADHPSELAVGERAPQRLILP